MDSQIGQALSDFEQTLRTFRDALANAARGARDERDLAFQRTRLTHEQSSFARPRGTLAPELGGRFALGRDTPRETGAPSRRAGP